ncbi:transposase [Actinomadura madurae]|uniref:transposase n=1 Tax=Actinomadura madurae TaxID=1993 RepID=UPI0034DAE9BA
MGDDRARYPHPAALLAETGLAPVTRASGRMHQVHCRYAASKRMRHAVGWWASTSTYRDFRPSRAAVRPGSPPWEIPVVVVHAAPQNVDAWPSRSDRNEDEGPSRR